MRKILLCTWGIFAIIIKSNGNNLIDSSKFSFTISLGASIPFRDFSAKNPQLISQNDSIASGFAKTGFHFDISADWYFIRHFGITVLFGGSLNQFNSSAYNNSVNFNEPTSTSANNFYLQEYQFGICYRFKLNSQITMDVKALWGEMEANFPNVNISFPATSMQPAGIVSWTVASSDAYVWCLNTGIRYTLCKHLRLLADISYSTATIKYPYYTISESLQGLYTLTLSYNKPAYMSLGLLKPTVGVAYCF